MGRTPADLLALTLAPALALAMALLASPARADEPPESDRDAERTGTTEGRDTTRLDVERLPPEAIEVTRDLYAHGFYVEGYVGGRGFVGGVGRVSSAGPLLGLRFGYEIVDWLFVGALVEASIHETRAPAPPARQVFELLDAMADVRLQVNPTAEFAMWIAGQVGVLAASTDILSLYGQPDASTVGLVYGGELGLDGHFHTRHLSLGVAGGVRMAPSLDRPDADMAIGVHGTAYIRYVF